MNDEQLTDKFNDNFTLILVKPNGDIKYYKSKPMPVNKNNINYHIYVNCVIFGHYSTKTKDKIMTDSLNWLQYKRTMFEFINDHIYFQYKWRSKNRLFLTYWTDINYIKINSDHIYYRFFKHNKFIVGTISDKTELLNLMEQHFPEN